MRSLILGAALAGLLASVTGSRAATLSYTFTGVTTSNATVVGNPNYIPPPQPFSFSVFIDSPISPLSDGRTQQLYTTDARDNYTVAGQPGYILGFDGGISTKIDQNTGRHQLILQGFSRQNLGFVILETDYQIDLESGGFTADFTKPGVYSQANGTLYQSPIGSTFVSSRIYGPGGVTPADVTYFDVQKLVITNSGYTTPSPVPLPRTLPLFAASLAVLGGFRLRRALGLRS